MKLLIDQGLGRACAALLRGAGQVSAHVAELCRHQDEDARLVDFARQGDQVIVTLDADFHAIVALSGLASPSVIWIRIEGLKSEQAAALVRTILTNCEDDLRAGALITVYPSEVRVRRLPIGKPSSS